MVMNNLKTTKTGFTLLETLLALVISSFCMLLIVATLHLSGKQLEIANNSQYQVALSELRLRMAPILSYDVFDDYLQFHLYGEERKLYLSTNRLVESPGFIIYADNIESINFYEMNSCIHIEIAISKEILDWVIYCV